MGDWKHSTSNAVVYHVLCIAGTVFARHMLEITGVTGPFHRMFNCLTVGSLYAFP
jgi:hypothetical protein